jgi:hypothetical protein
MFPHITESTYDSENKDAEKVIWVKGGNCNGEGWNKLHNEELQDLDSGLNITTAIKSKSIR